MKTKATIAGLHFELKFCNKVNTEPINGMEISQMPLASITQAQSLDTYEVNIMQYVPTNLEDIPVHNQSSFYLVADKLLFTYNGVSIEETSIGEAKITCRNFTIDYDNRDDNPKEFNLYHTKLHYNITQSLGQSVEAIIVFGQNLDPETSRGTVTTVRDGNG